MLAGVLGLVSAAAITRIDAQRTNSAVADAEGSSTHHRATLTTAQVDDHHVTVDLTAVTPANVLPLLAALVTAVAAARVAGRRTTVPTMRIGRAPPRL